jgi:acetylornithine deacetylase/succinyl-diaminopimelate desuccinylase-like protein
VVDEIEAALRRLLAEVAASRGLELHVEHRLGQPGMRFDERICALLEAACVDVGVSWRRMPSAAGHDAQLIGRLCPAAMLFVPSKNGHSHRPDEETDLSHIILGVEVLVQTLFRLAYLR